MTETHVYRVVDAQTIAPEVKRLVVEAPRVARKHKPGQFVIVRVSHDGERIPLTISESDPEAGTIALVVQGVGATTHEMIRLEPGAALADVAGPLGRPSEIERVGTVVTIGGGVGTAIAYPTSVAMKDAGNHVIAIVGGRTSAQVILDHEMRLVCDEVIVTTDDGSAGFHGFVTQALQQLIDQRRAIDLVVAIGPIPMMRAVAELTRPYGISTIASLNPIMVDGTGMCGGCRVSVAGETKFACVDGPEFDAHLVDFELLDRRNRSYLGFERERDLGACAANGSVR